MTEVKMSVSQTFATQSEAWLFTLQNRRRRPAKPASLATLRSYVRRHVEPVLGPLPIQTFGNAEMKAFVSYLSSENLKPKTILEVSNAVKQIIASAVDPQTGDCLYPRTWNADFIDAPSVNPAEQNTPTVSAAEIEAAIKSSEPVFANLYALLGGSGLRIGETLSIKIDGPNSDTTFDTTAGVIHVRKSVWRSELQAPKTPSAIRTVELAPELVDMLAKFAGDRKGFLFGNHLPLNESSARAHLTKQNICGFHSFRRFRATHLRASGVPEQITKAWLGHSDSDITSRYSQLGKDAVARREWAEKVGLGFQL